MATYWHTFMPTANNASRRRTKQTQRKKLLQNIHANFFGGKKARKRTKRDSPKLIFCPRTWLMRVEKTTANFVADSSARGRGFDSHPLPHRVRPWQADHADMPMPTSSSPLATQNVRSLRYADGKITAGLVSTLAMRHRLCGASTYAPIIGPWDHDIHCSKTFWYRDNSECIIYINEVRCSDHNSYGTIN